MSKQFNLILFITFITIFYSLPILADSKVEIPVNHEIYLLLDRLKTLHLINDIDLAIKPHTGDEILRVLDGLMERDARGGESCLTERDRQEIAEFRRMFQQADAAEGAKLSKIGLNLTANRSWLRIEPVYRLFHGAGGAPDLDGKKPLIINTMGVNAYGSYLNFIGIHFKFTDTREWNNNEKNPYIYSTRTSPGYKGIWENKKDYFDYDESSASLTLSLRRRSYIMFGKEALSWGPGTRSFLSLSDKPPSYPHVKFYAEFGRIFNFTYIHGSLDSGVIDSVKTNWNDPVDPRKVYVDKYIGAHRLGINLGKRAVLGLGESIIYAGRGVEPIYLIPFAFIWSSQHYLRDKDNTQMFGDITLYPVKRIKLYGSVFIDEIYLAKALDKEENHNWIGFQGGVRFEKLPGFPENTSMFAEYTRLNPGAYQHKWKENEFSSYGAPLGFWAGRNADDLYVEFLWRFVRFDSNLRLCFGSLRKGDEIDPGVLYEKSSYPFLKQGHSRRTLINADFTCNFLNSLSVGFGGSYVKWKDLPPEQDDFEKFCAKLSFGCNFY